MELIANGGRPAMTAAAIWQRSTRTVASSSRVDGCAVSRALSAPWQTAQAWIVGAWCSHDFILRQSLIWCKKGERLCYFWGLTY